MSSSNFSINNPAEKFFAAGKVSYDPNNFEVVNNSTAPPSGSNDPDNCDVPMLLGNQLTNCTMQFL